MRCGYYMIIFGMAIRDKHGRVGQGKPGFPHFADDAIPDSIIMNMICRNLLPSAEPKIRSTEVGLTPVALRILNTIMPVIRAFTVMDAAKPVIVNVFGQ